MLNPSKYMSVSMSMTIYVYKYEGEYKTDRGIHMKMRE